MSQSSQACDSISAATSWYSTSSSDLSWASLVFEEQTQEATLTFPADLTAEWCQLTLGIWPCARTVTSRGQRTSFLKSCGLRSHMIPGSYPLVDDMKVERAFLLAVDDATMFSRTRQTELGCSTMIAIVEISSIPGSQQHFSLLEATWLCEQDPY